MFNFNDSQIRPFRSLNPDPYSESALSGNRVEEENRLVGVDPQSTAGTSGSTSQTVMTSGLPDLHRTLTLSAASRHAIASFMGNAKAIGMGALGSNERTRIAQAQRIAAKGLADEEALDAFRLFCGQEVNRYLVGPLCAKLAKGIHLLPLERRFGAVRELLSWMPKDSSEARGLAALLGSVPSLPPDDQGDAFFGIFERLTRIPRTMDKELANGVDGVSHAVTMSEPCAAIVSRLLDYATELRQDMRIDLAASVCAYAVRAMFETGGSSEAPYVALMNKLADFAMELMLLPEFGATGKGPHLVRHLTEMLVNTVFATRYPSRAEMKMYLANYGGDDGTMVNIILLYDMMDYGERDTIFESLLEKAQSHPAALAEILRLCDDQRELGLVLQCINALDAEGRKVAADGDWAASAERIFEGVSGNDYVKAFNFVRYVIRRLRDNKDVQAEIRLLLAGQVDSDGADFKSLGKKRER